MPKTTPHRPDAPDPPGAPPHAPHPLHGPTTDIGRRVTARREELSLTREEVAERCGAAPAYLQYVEEHAAVPGTSMMLRLAAALETTVAVLTGGTLDLPPGRASAPRGTELRDLDEDECWALLHTHGIGRVGTRTPDGPAIVPVNYLVAGREVALRTAQGAVPATAAGTEVVFEVDHIDEACSQGWSVLVVGRGRVVDDEDAVRRMEETVPGLSWAGEEHGLWLTIAPERISGSRVVNPHAASPHPTSHPTGGTAPPPVQL